MRNQLVMKARRDRAATITESMFKSFERRPPKDDRPAETVDEFLRRGGRITIIPERRK